MCELMMDKYIYLEFIFDHIILKNTEAHKICKFYKFFGFFYEFSGFSAKIVRPIYSQRNGIDRWFLYHEYNFSSSTR